jgi:hypothetical protein
MSMAVRPRHFAVCKADNLSKNANFVRIYPNIDTTGIVQRDLLTVCAISGSSMSPSSTDNNKRYGDVDDCQPGPRDPV